MDGGKVYIRKFVNARQFKKCFGDATLPDAWKDARAELAEIEKQLRAGKFKAEQKATRVLIPDAVALYSTKKGGDCRYQLSGIAEFFKTTYLDELTYLHLKAYKEWRLAQTTTRRHILTGELQPHPVKPATANRELASLNAMISGLRHMVEIQQIKPLDFPSPLLSKTFRKEVGWYDERLSARNRTLTNEECRLFVEKYATPRVAKAAALALNTALRRKDLFALDQKNKAGSQIRGEQSKVGQLYVVPMNENVEDAFDEANDKVLDDTNFRREWEESRKRFMEDGAKHLQSPEARKAFKDAGNGYFQWKDLRRTSLRKLWDETKDLLLCRDVAGHKDAKTTQRYLGLTERDIHAAGEVFRRNFTFNIAGQNEEAV